jgi:hypothetical protein
MRLVVASQLSHECLDLGPWTFHSSSRCLRGDKSGGKNAMRCWGMVDDDSDHQLIRYAGCATKHRILYSTYMQRSLPAVQYRLDAAYASSITSLPVSETRFATCLLSIPVILDLRTTSPHLSVSFRRILIPRSLQHLTCFQSSSSISIGSSARSPAHFL